VKNILLRTLVVIGRILIQNECYWKEIDESPSSHEEEGYTINGCMQRARRIAEH